MGAVIPILLADPHRSCCPFLPSGPRLRGRTPPRPRQRPGVVQEPIEALAERPERPQLGEIRQQLLQVLLLRLGQFGRALDDQEAVLPDERRLLPSGWTPLPPPGLLPLAGAAA